jgi:sulfur-carrier protein
MNVVVKLFAAYQEAYGVPEIQLEVAEGTTVQQIGDRIRAPHPHLQGLTEVTRYGVNLSFVSPDTVVQAGDEIVCIPPVSGG